MAKPSVKNIVIWSKVANGARFNWDVAFDTVTSSGAVKSERKHFVFKTRPRVWDLIRQFAIDADADELSPPAAPVRELPGWYDATASSLTEIADADKPVV